MKNMPNQDLEDFLAREEKADKGQPEFQISLARSYAESSKNRQAFYYYCLARRSHPDDISVQVEIREFIDRFIQTSPEEALSCFQLTANQNDPLALYCLAEYFLNGVGISQSIKKAFTYYRLASLHGYFFSLVPIAQCLFDRGMKRKIIIHLLKSIISDKPKIQARQYYELANLFKEGKILLRSPQAALHFYILSAELGYKPAQKYLAEIYFHGLLGAKKNEQLAIHYYLLTNKTVFVRDLAKQYEETCPKRAFDYYRLVYETDKAMGASCLGHCYEKGIGVEQSLDTAIHYYKIAYEGGLKFPCLHLGHCLEEMGTEEKLEQAIHYYQIGAQYENNQCQYRLAELFEQGKGLYQSFKKAFHYYKLAAQNGCSKAWVQVARCFANGIGTEKCEKIAFNAYQEGALRDCIESRYQLAICYIDGLGVNKSIKKGIDHLLIALKSGHQGASNKLAETL